MILRPGSFKYFMLILNNLNNSKSIFLYTNFRYWGKENYMKLLKAKHFWDPQNIFNHCHSVGSTKEDCCPRDAL